MKKKFLQVENICRRTFFRFIQEVVLSQNFKITYSGVFKYAKNDEINKKKALNCFENLARYESDSIK